LSSSNGGFFYTIKDDPSNTTEGLIDQINNFDKKQKAFEERRRKKEQQQANKREDDDPAAVFRYAHFICTRPLGPRVVIPRQDVGAIQAHKEQCDYCISKKREIEEAEELQREGPLRIRYIVHQLVQARQDIEDYQSMKAELKAKREKGGEEEAVTYLDKEKLRRASYDASVAESTIKKERVELHKLLHHENEIIRKGAEEEYQKIFPRLVKTIQFIEKLLGKHLLYPEKEAEKEYEEAYEWWRKI
jgi:hypothetical protein